MLTSQDIKLLIESFKTRSEADADLQKLGDEFNIRFNKVLDKLDAVIKELKSAITLLRRTIFFTHYY